jgi:hypothetical protein
MATDQVYEREITELKPSVNHSYFYMPPAWIGEAPTAGELTGWQINLVKVVCSRTLSVGVRIDAHRDGVFLFDFTGWPEGCPLSIPAHTIIGGKRLPENVLNAQREAEEHRYKCMSLMNAHLACMSTAMSKVQGHGVAIRQVITPSSYFTTHWQGGGRRLVGIESHADPILAYVSANFGLDHDIFKQRVRTTIRLDTVEHSFDLLERIVVSTVPDALLLTTLIYRAAINYGQHEFPTALTLSWTVCEKLLRILWDNYINDKTIAVDSEGKQTQVINKDRKKILQGRDFTASVIAETLALTGLLKHGTYLRLTTVRRRRNDWLHNLEPISGIMASDCIKTAELFFKEVSGIELAIHLSYSARL